MDGLRGSLSREAILPAVLAGFAAALIYLSKDNNPTAALFPRVVGVVTVAAIALELFLHGAKAARGAADAGIGWVEPIALQTGYIALIYLLGFSTATLLFLLACPWRLRYRRWGVIAVHAVLLTVVIVGMFQSVFHIRLPGGMIPLPW